MIRRKQHTDRGSVPASADDLNFSSLRTHKLVTDRKPKARPRRFRCKEWIKYPVEIGGRDAVPRVIELDADRGTGTVVDIRVDIYAQIAAVPGHGFNGVLYYV